MIDIGVNIQHETFLKDLTDTIAQSQAAGVEAMICIASDLEESAFLQNLCKTQPSLWPTLGCHPHQASSWNTNSLDEIEQMISTRRPVAIGETGLDFNRNYSTPDEQRYAFREQIELSLRHNLPLYLHERDAHEEMIDTLKSIAGQQIKGVIHCFTGDQQQLENYLALGLHIGVTGWVCDERRGQALQQAVPDIPLDRLLLETDAPYLLPRTIRPRPKKNHPKYLPWVAEEVAKLKGISTQALIKQTDINTHNLFTR
ncbi:TatD family hydrolase [Marinomonas pollencensis]|uniref:Sec-independent protein translocase TatD n=1 Tax=Marinomonas pollencensis TaxID=491954 RepID=A0A3E0DRP9_9GAMM|nr:TatD family hydrolase [Marinomonas pollencensis]REG85684.1 Sec-independent protein translocase TatD [Marinomonas pollencensis]